MEFDIPKVTSWKKTLFKDFEQRWNEYSWLGWKNRKGLGKSDAKWQVPAFAIRLVSDKAINGIKKFPEIYNEIRKISLAFQYIKYKPKEAARLRAANYLKESRIKMSKINRDRKAHWYKTLKMPTRETLWIVQKMEQFKENYPKILIRKNDWTIDYIKSDWTGYLTTMINAAKDDKEVLGSQFFFKIPATNKATNKADIEEKLFRKIKKMLDRIEQIINGFKYWSSDIYKSDKWEVIRLAKSLTFEWLNKEIERKEKLQKDKELSKKVSFWDVSTNENLFSLDNSEINQELIKPIAKSKKEVKKLDLWLDWGEEI